MTSKERARVLIADDHAGLRAGLHKLLDTQPDMAVVGEAETAEQAVALDAELRPDVVIMDLTLPTRTGVRSTVPSGLEAIRRIKTRRPQARVLALTRHEAEGYQSAVMDAGGGGYVPKDAADTELLPAIRAVWQSGIYVHPEHASPPPGAAATTSVCDPATDVRQVEDGSYEQLSPREREVLRLMALGHTNQQVADRLCLSVKTVETYKSRLMGKLGLKGRAALVRYALRRGLLEERQKQQP